MKEIIEFQGYQIEIRRRRYLSRLGVSIYPNGKISISANKTLSQKAIFKFLLEKKDWIEKCVAEADSFRKKYPPKTFQPGEIYPYLGHDYPLEFVIGEKPKIQFLDGRLLFFTPKKQEDISREELQKYFKTLKKSYKEVAQRVMTQRVDFYSQKMNLYPTGLGFRSQKTIWGSCSPENRISLNTKLIIAPLAVIDYVVVHELAHIKHKNHSQRFWGLVEKYVSTREFSKKWLAENQYQADFLSTKSELWS